MYTIYKHLYSSLCIYMNWSINVLSVKFGSERKLYSSSYKTVVKILVTALSFIDRNKKSFNLCLDLLNCKMKK